MGGRLPRRGRHPRYDCEDVQRGHVAVGAIRTG